MAGRDLRSLFHLPPLVAATAAISLHFRWKRASSYEGGRGALSCSMVAALESTSRGDSVVELSIALLFIRSARTSCLAFQQIDEAHELD